MKNAPAIAAGAFFVLDLFRGGSGLGQIRTVGAGCLGRTGERELRVLAGAFAVPALDIDRDQLTRAELFEEDLLGELVLDLALDGAPQRTGTEHRIEATLGQQGLGLVRSEERRVGKEC